MEQCKEKIKFVVGKKITTNEVTHLLDKCIIPTNSGIDSFKNFNDYAQASLEILEENKDLFTQS